MPKTHQHKILFFLIAMVFVYVIWELYEEFSTSLIESHISNSLLSSITELQQLLVEQRTDISKLEKEINCPKETSTEFIQIPTNDNPLSSIPTLSIEDLFSPQEVSNTKSLALAHKQERVKKAVKTIKAVTPAEKQFLSASPYAYTLQLIGTRKIKNMNAFITTHHLKEKTKLLHLSHHKQDWYILLYGVYKNYPDATLAKVKLSKSLHRSDIWIRLVADIQKEIKKRKI